MAVISAVIFGKMRNEAEFMPIMSMASICCVTLMVPNSDAMFDPTFPDRMRHIIEDENSNSIISRVVNPLTHTGIHALWMFIFIWMQMTAPMNSEMRSTIPMESMPSDRIS